MALYSFDGTWNSDEDKIVEQTNVVRFRELFGDTKKAFVAKKNIDLYLFANDMPSK